MENLKQFQNALSKLTEVNRQLTIYGITINMQFGDIEFDLPDYIKDKIEKESPIDRPNYTEELALQLACFQEHINAPATDNDINFINSFFETNITKELINKMYLKYL